MRSEIIKDIKSKKELRDLDEKFIKNRISGLYKTDFKDFNKKSKDYKKFFKEIRKKLREVYGAFKYIKDEKDTKTYKFIFSKIGKPKSILDLGFGYTRFPFKDIEYYGAEIGQDYIDKGNEYLKKNKIKGKCFIFSLVDEDINKLPNVDVVFLFRVLESLESIKKNISKNIIKDLRCKYIVVSFAKRVLGNKEYIRKKGRKWFRVTLKKLGYKYEIFDYEDDIYFVIKKI